jgi:DNA-binding winged helix-turn-helix (wHTH) protein/TolB-like protein/Tfp pilus assembly protein PilF
MPVGPESLATPGNERLQVGGWTVEPTLNQLSAPGRTVKLEPKAMAVLLHLADRPRRVVSREALISAVWPGVVVSDDALTQVVVKLRKALGDAPDEPAYIQTIAKGGYRLVAPVLRSAEQPPEPNLAELEPLDGGRKWRSLWLAGAGIAALLLAAAGTWWIRGEYVTSVSPGQAAGGTRTARSAPPTVAIRPFEALGNDPQETLLARGITADLMTDLSKVSGLSVISASPTSGQVAGEAPIDAPPIHYFVSGTVQRVDERLRLHVHLTDAETGKPLWSERFDRAMAGLFEIQDELGPKILHMLPVKISEAELRRVARRYTRNLDAYETYQRGQSALHVRRKAENESARDMFRRAIALDAGFARAYTGLAQTYAADYRNQWTEDRAAALDRAFELARTAHQINPDIPETYWMLAYVHVHRGEHEQALQHLETAVRLYPSYADGYAFMGAIHSGLGRPADGVLLLRTAMRLMPESGYLYFMLLGRAYLFLGDLEQARVNLKHALSRNPEFLDARVYMAAVHVASGDKAAAAWEAEEIRALQPGFTIRRWLETNPTADVTLRTKLMQALGELGF